MTRRHLKPNHWLQRTKQQRPSLGWLFTTVLGYHQNSRVILLRQGRESQIAFTLGAKTVRGQFAPGNTSHWIDIGHVDLDGGVVLAFHQTVGPTAFAGDIQVHVEAFFVLHDDKRCWRSNVYLRKEKKAYASSE